MFITFSILFKGALRDRVSLIWAIVFPVVFLIALGFIFPSPGYRQHLLAGMLALSILFFSLQGIAFESLYQRNSGVYKLLRATPYRTIAFITQLTLARSVVALLSGAVVLIIGMALFHMWLSWQSILLLLPLLVVATLCFTFLGVIVSNFAQNETQVAMLNNIVTLPMMFGSEVFYSMGNLPVWVKDVSHILPLSYLIDGEHAALATYAPGIAIPMLALLGFSIVSLTLAVLTFRWDPDATPIRRLLRMHAV